MAAALGGWNWLALTAGDWLVTAIVGGYSVVGFTAGEWVALLSAINVTAVVSTVVAVVAAARQHRKDRMTSDAAFAAVPRAEAETALKILTAALKDARADIVDLRAQIEKCRQWQASHTAICPLYRNEDGDK